MVGIRYMKLTNIISSAKVIPNLATNMLIRMALGELVVHNKKRQRVPDAERANEKISPILSPNLR